MRIVGIRLGFRRRRTPLLDHWDHPSQVEERSRDGKFTPEAERRRPAALRDSSLLLPAPVAVAEAPAPAGKSPLEAIGAALDEAGGLFAPQARRQVDEALASRAGRPFAPDGERPYASAPAGGPDAAAFRRLGPVYRPAPAAPTSPFPAIARPCVPPGPLDRGVAVTIAEEPVIGDSLPALAAEAPAPPPAAMALLPDSVLCCSPGWAAHLMSARVRSGEWDELDLIVERGWGRNAAEEAAQHRHVRERLPDRARQLCAALGEPGKAGELLDAMDRMGELQAAAGAR